MMRDIISGVHFSAILDYFYTTSMENKTILKALNLHANTEYSNSDRFFEKLKLPATQPYKYH